MRKTRFQPYREAATRSLQGASWHDAWTEMLRTEYEVMRAALAPHVFVSPCAHAAIMYDDLCICTAEELEELVYPGRRADCRRFDFCGTPCVRVAAAADRVALVPEGEPLHQQWKGAAPPAALQVVRVGTDGHVGVALVDHALRRVEYFDSDGQAETAFLPAADGLNWARRTRRGKAARTNDAVFEVFQLAAEALFPGYEVAAAQAQLQTDPEDVYCHTWIWVWVWERAVTGTPPLQLLRQLRGCSDRKDRVTRAWESIVAQRRPCFDVK